MTVTIMNIPDGLSLPPQGGISFDLDEEATAELIKALYAQLKHVEAHPQARRP